MGERRKIAEAKYNEADKCYRDGNYAGALVLLEELIAEYPGERNLLFAQARALYKLERYEESLAIVETVIDEYGARCFEWCSFSFFYFSVTEFYNFLVQ